MISWAPVVRPDDYTLALNVSPYRGVLGPRRITKSKDSQGLFGISLTKGNSLVGTGVWYLILKGKTLRQTSTQTQTWCWIILIFLS